MERQKIFTAERMLSISAMLISLLTLIVFIRQTNMMRKQQHLSVMPYLSSYYQGTGTPNFIVTLSNDGIGPAFIESVIIGYKGKEYETDLSGFLEEQVPEFSKFKRVSHSNLWVGKMIPAGESVNILRVSNSQEEADALIQMIDTFEIDRYDIIYRSFYNERWKLAGDSHIPEKL